MWVDIGPGRLQLQDVSSPVSIFAFLRSQLTLSPTDETLVFRPSLARDSSGTDEYWLGLLVSPERKSSCLDIRLSALTTHVFTPVQNTLFSGAPSRTIPSQRIGTGWYCPLLQYSGSPASTFGFPLSQSPPLLPHENTSFPCASSLAIPPRLLDVCSGRLPLSNVSSPALIRAFPPSRFTILPLARYSHFPAHP